MRKIRDKLQARKSEDTLNDSESAIDGKLKVGRRRERENDWTVLVRSNYSKMHEHFLCAWE